MSDKPFSKWLWYETCRAVVRLVACFAWRLRYSGQEHVPASGGVLVVANHQSHLDPPLVGAGCRRQMHFLARVTLFDFRPFAWLIHSLDAIPLDREGIGLSGVKETMRWLKQGNVVLVFPEATRTADGEIRPFKPGFAAMATRAGAAILPTAIQGAYDAWPRSRRFPRTGTIHIHFGPPIFPEEAQTFDEHALVAEVERRVRDCQAMLRRRPAFAGD